MIGEERMTLCPGHSSKDIQSLNTSLTSLPVGRDERKERERDNENVPDVRRRRQLGKRRELAGIR